MMTGGIDFLADTWRWWGAMGAALAIWPVGRWLYTFDPQTTPHFSDTVRWILGLGLLAALVATLVAGAIIPLASDGRIEGFTHESPAFRGGTRMGDALASQRETKRPSQRCKCSRFPAGRR